MENWKLCSCHVTVRWNIKDFSHSSLQKAVAVSRWTTRRFFNKSGLHGLVAREKSCSCGNATKHPAYSLPNTLRVVSKLLEQSHLMQWDQNWSLWSRLKSVMVNEDTAFWYRSKPTPISVICKSFHLRFVHIIQTMDLNVAISRLGGAATLSPSTWDFPVRKSLFLVFCIVPPEDGDWVADDEEEDLAHVPYTPPRYSEETMLQRSKDMYALLNQRRSVRFISPEPVPREVIDNAILTAGMCTLKDQRKKKTFSVGSEPVMLSFSLCLPHLASSVQVQLPVGHTQSPGRLSWCQIRRWSTRSDW